jgi:NAD(P)-dependent dehydrogenase (short-subunit alcohol dehydrogenase family)
MFRLDGEVALITGSSRGIGRAIAERMAEAGAKVVVSGRNAEPCQEVVDAITAAGGEAMAYPCHIGRKELVQAMCAEVKSKFGKIDHLVLNAATNPHMGPSHTISDEAFDKTFTTNLKSAYWFIQECVEDMASRGHGSMTFLASIAGISGNGAIGTYGITKAANAHLAKNMAIEWGPKGIRSNAIAPGLIKTDFAEALWKNPKLAEATINATPLRRLGDPDDIAGIAVFLASKAAAFVNGQTIVADGGVTVADRLAGAH